MRDDLVPSEMQRVADSLERRVVQLARFDKRRRGEVQIAVDAPQRDQARCTLLDDGVAREAGRLGPCMRRPKRRVSCRVRTRLKPASAPANGNSSVTVRIRTAYEPPRAGAETNVVSERFVQREKSARSASVRSSPSRTTATGLPCKAAAPKTST